MTALCHLAPMKCATLLIVFPCLILMAGCNSISGLSSAETTPPTHEAWDSLLQKYVSDEGRVNYQGILADSTSLNRYLSLLGENHPNRSWSEDEQLAYWINAYNAFTVQLIVRNYPVESIKDLGGAIYKVNTAWDIKFVQIGDRTYDLNNIEHDIIRANFEEPRIHFAVNCASVSCPKLSNKAYTAAQLDEQLTAAAKGFVNNPSKNTLSATGAELSRIFKWFKGDFTDGGLSLVEFINQFAETKLSEDTAIDYREYDWNLNE